MSDSESRHEEEVEQQDEVQSSTSSYASPKDYVSVSSGLSDSRPHQRTDQDAPTVERLERTDPSEEATPSGQARTEPDLPSPSISEPTENGDMSDGIEWKEVMEEMQSEDDVDFDVVDELAYEHRPKESTPTRASLSQAARELTTEGVPKGDKKLARSLSGLTAEVLGDEGRANSPLDDPLWRRQEKHFFILSSAGKPIYSRYGDEGALCGMMAILEAIHSVVLSKGEEPICIADGPVKIVFLSKEPVVLVAVSRRKESVKWILKQLDYLYHHLLCLATGALLNVLKQNPGRDIRMFLKGSNQLTEGLLRDFGINPGLFLEAFCPVRMLPAIRSNAMSILHEAAKACQARASFLLFDGQVVSMTQETGSQLQIMDLLLLLNFVLSNELYRSQSTAEFNAPICMPHLHETAFLHAYIYFLESNPDLVVILLMTQPDTFHLASEARVKMEKRLRDSGVVHSLQSKNLTSRPSGKGQVLMEELPLAAGGGRREFSAVQTFLFRQKSTTRPQYVLCQPSRLLSQEVNWTAIVSTLASIHSDRSTGRKSSLKFYWHMDGHRSILYEGTTEWEMYLVCDPLTLKDHAHTIQKQIVRFLLSDQVKEELFIPFSDK